MWRSVAAILGGFVLIGVLAFGTDAGVRQMMPEAFDATGRTDSIPLLVATIVYVGIYATLGCYLAAFFAPSHPMRHALILGGLGLAFNIVGTIQMWNTAPAWFHVVSLLLVMPYAWLGGRIRERQLAGSGGAQMQAA